MNPLVTTLEATRARLTRPRNWIKGTDAAVGTDLARTISWNVRVAGSIPSDDYDCFCLRGGIIKSAPDPKTAGEAIVFLAETIVATAPDGDVLLGIIAATGRDSEEVEHQEPGFIVTSWNDYAARSHQQVLDMLDTTIARARLA